MEGITIRRQAFIDSGRRNTQRVCSSSAPVYVPESATLVRARSSLASCRMEAQGARRGDLLIRQRVGSVSEKEDSLAVQGCTRQRGINSMQEAGGEEHIVADRSGQKVGGFTVL